MKRLFILGGVVPLLFLCMGVTDCGMITRDPGFDLWCGDKLCVWKVDQGHIAPVPTWHDGDLGVSLVDDGTSISQVSPVNYHDGTCISFEMVANIDPDAEVHLQLDVFGDGFVDYDTRIPTSSWAPLVIKVAITAPYQGIRFRLTKTGTGQAVLADIKATTSTGCPGAPIALPPRPEGAFCMSPDQCQSGMCNPSGFREDVCAGCRSDGDCAPGEACGVDDRVENVLEPYRACIPAASRNFGEQCVENAECKTGTCYGGSCSTCNGTCTNSGDTCKKMPQSLIQPDGMNATWSTPGWECLPPAGFASGHACFAGAECASGKCQGGTPLHVCDSDGRSCTTDADCPMETLRLNYRCIVVGTVGGSCQ